MLSAGLRASDCELDEFAGSRNGLRDTGRGGGPSNGEVGESGLLALPSAGEAARLRKGLLDWRLTVRPVDLPGS